MWSPSHGLVPYTARGWSPSHGLVPYTARGVVTISRARNRQGCGHPLRASALYRQGLVLGHIPPLSPSHGLVPYTAYHHLVPYTTSFVGHHLTGQCPIPPGVWSPSHGPVPYYRQGWVTISRASALYRQGCGHHLTGQCPIPPGVGHHLTGQCPIPPGVWSPSHGPKPRCVFVWYWI